jgi:uncharacterized membrane protein YdjX (TVP38/TMEM64 family)
MSVSAKPQDGEDSPAEKTELHPPEVIEKHGGLVLTLVGLALTVGVFAAVPSLRHSVVLLAHGNLDGLREYIRSLHFGGAVLLFALILGHAVVPYLSEILTGTSGFVYGFLPGLALAIVGWTGSAVISYWLGRTIGRPLLRALLGQRFTRLERAMKRGGAQLMLVVRFVPIVPFSLLGYAAGATRQSLWSLVWTSFIGYLPLTAAVAYLGSQAKSFSASDPLVWVAVVVLVGLLVASRIMIKRQQRRGQPLI